MPVFIFDPPPVVEDEDEDGGGDEKGKGKDAKKDDKGTYERAALLLASATRGTTS
jgi:hypothetical protein